MYALSHFFLSYLIDHRYIFERNRRQTRRAVLHTDQDCYIVLAVLWLRFGRSDDANPRQGVNCTSHVYAYNRYNSSADFLSSVPHLLDRFYMYHAPRYGFEPSPLIDFQELRTLSHSQETQSDEQHSRIFLVAFV